MTLTSFLPGLKKDDSGDGPFVIIIGSFSETTKYKILSRFPTGWKVAMLPPEEDVFQQLSNCQVLIPEHFKIDEEVLAKAPKLKLVQTGAGYDNIDIPACTRHGVWVANGAGVNAQAVAEHTMALMLAYYKNITYLDRFMKDKRIERQLNYQGGELSGQTIGIVGLGKIGQRVAELCQAFGMKVQACVRHKPSQLPGFIKLVSFDELLHTSDIVSVHVSLNTQTKGLFNKEVFQKMKKKTLLINTARGGVINEVDLLEALKQGIIEGACLDVFAKEPLALDSELRNLPNVILTPHTAGFPDGAKYHKRRYDFFVNNIQRVLKGQEPINKL